MSSLLDYYWYLLGNRSPSTVLYTEAEAPFHPFGPMDGHNWFVQISSQ
jgi:hypothetical protein